MKWKAIGSSVEGTSHKQGNIPCQDYSEHKVIDDVIVGAVADGAGSAKFSDIGAKLAVQTALSHLEEFFKNLKEEKKRDLQQPILSELAREVFREVFSEILDKVKNELKAKASDKECDFNDLACTLLAFIATPDWIAAMQIGDGFIVVRAENSNEYKLFFPPDKGEYANETIFVTSKDAHYKMDVLDNPKFICASTDGLERLAINFRDWKPSSGFFKPFEEGLKMTENLEQEEEDIKKWLASEDVNTRTDDDKTLLLCLYEGESKSKVYSSHGPSINLDYIKPQKLAKEAIPSPSIKKQMNIIVDFLIVSFVCNILTGYLLASLLWMEPKPKKWIFFVFGITTILWISYITFIHLVKWLNKTKFKPINYQYKLKNYNKLFQLTYKIRAIIVTLSNTILGLLIGIVLEVV
jgi:Protein phosphatase 2C